MSRSIRKTYSDKTRYMTRFDAGSIQKLTGLPASFIHRLREGEIKNPSRNSVLKLEKLYDRYWNNRLEKGGYTDKQRAMLLRQNDREKMREGIQHNKEVARKIRDARRERDRANPKLKGYRDNWHTMKNVLEQMKKDVDRTPDEWDAIAKYGSKPKQFKTKTKEEDIDYWEYDTDEPEEEEEE